MGKRGPKKGTRYKKAKVIKKSEPLPREVIEGFSHAEPPKIENLKTSDSVEFNPLDFITLDKPDEEKKPEEKKPDLNIEEEAAGVLAGCFELGAIVTDVPAFALTLEEKLASTPSFIPIYQKYIKPSFGDHTDLVVFAMVMSGIVAKRVPMVTAKFKKEKNASDTITVTKN